jgi:hypothetical protein
MAAWGAVTPLVVVLRSGTPSDLHQVLFASRAMWHGADPYALIGPGRQFDLGFPFLYPLSAALIVSPLAPLPFQVARVLFAALSSGALAYLVARRKPEGLALFWSAPFLTAVSNGQWSVLALAGTLSAPLGALALAAKPSIGAAMLAASPTRRHAVIAVGGAALLALVCLAFLPTWPLEWRTALASARHLRAPITMFGGPLVALALLRWRCPEARLLLVLACVPHTVAWYDELLLFAVPATRREALWLTLSMFVGALVIILFVPREAPDQWARANAIALVWSGYLPCLWMVLRRRNGAPMVA